MHSFLQVITFSIFALITIESSSNVAPISSPQDNQSKIHELQKEIKELELILLEQKIEIEKIKGKESIALKDFYQSQTQLNVLSNSFSEFNNTTNNRISDLDSSQNTFGVLFSSLITLLVLILAYASYTFSKSSTTEQIKSWVEDRGNSLLQKLLERKLQDDNFQNQLKKIIEESESFKTVLTTQFDEMKPTELTEDSMLSDIKKDYLLAGQSFSKENYTLTLEYIDKVVNKITQKENPTNEDYVILSSVLYNKGITLEKLGQEDQEIETYSTLIQQFHNSSDEGILENVASAYLNKAVVLGNTGKPDEEIALYDEFIEKFKHSTNSKILEDIAKAHVNKGVALSNHKGSKEAIYSYEQFIKKFSNNNDPKILSKVAKAYTNLAIEYLSLDLPEKALATYELLIDKFLTSTEYETHIELGYALLNKGTIFRQQNELLQALSAYEEFINKFNDSSDNILLELIAGALLNKSAVLKELEQYPDAGEVLKLLIERFKNNDNSNIQEVVSKAYLNMGVIFEELGNQDAEIKTYQEFIEQQGKTENSNIQELVVSSYLNLASTFIEIDKYADAITSYQKLIHDFAFSKNSNIQHLIAKAFIYLSSLYIENNQFKESIKTCDTFFKHYSTPSEEERILLAHAHNIKGAALLKMKEHKKALQVFKALIQTYKDDPREDIKIEIARAHYDLACIYSKYLQDKELALHNLKNAFELGWSDFKLLQSDSDLDFLRESAEFIKLLKEHFPEINK